MRKRCHRKIRPKALPTVVAASLAPDLALSERLALNALRGGYCSTGQFNMLLDCCSMLRRGTAAKGDAARLVIAVTADEVLGSIRDRWASTQKVNATDEELQVLSTLVDVSEDFWNRTAGHKYAEAYQQVAQLREQQYAELRGAA